MNGATRVMELSGKLFNNQFQILQGIDIPRGINQLIYVSDMAYIRPWNTTEEPSKLLRIYEIPEIKNLEDNFKEIVVNNAKQGENLLRNESQIMLLVKLAAIKTIKLTGTATKIAGRFSNEGIFLLEDGDTIIIEFIDGTYEFTAVKLKGEMHLIQMY